MNSPGYFRIPGHSGTDFKHRKAFEARKKYYKLKLYKSKDQDKNPVPSDENLKNESFSSWQQPRWEKWMKLLMVLPVVLFTILGCILFKEIALAFPSNYKIKKDAKVIYTSTRENAYHILVTEGYRYFKAGDMEFAQRDFQQSLKVFPYRSAGNLGLTKTLISRCITEGKYCAEAESNLLFLKSLKGIDSKEVKSLEEMMPL